MKFLNLLYTHGKCEILSPNILKVWLSFGFIMAIVLWQIMDFNFHWKSKLLWIVVILVDSRVCRTGPSSEAERQDKQIILSWPSFIIFFMLWGKFIPPWLALHACFAQLLCLRGIWVVGINWSSCNFFSMYVTIDSEDPLKCSQI
jgi:hypothetical protein